MSNMAFGICNSLVLVVLGCVLFLSYKMKKKNGGTNDYLNNLQIAFESQDQLINHTSQSLLSLASVLRNMSDMLNARQLTLNVGNSLELAQVLKEVSYRINDVLSPDVSNYKYSILVGDCFLDLENCLVLLTKILKESGKNEIQDIVQNFKFSLTSTALAAQQS